MVRFAEELEVPTGALADYINFITDPQHGEWREIGKRVSQLFRSRILYLPTFRRIEEELKSIFPDREPSELPLRKKIEEAAAQPRAWVEMVEFGMEDVEKKIADKMSELKDNVRTGLSHLTGSYLGDVLTGRYKEVLIAPVINARDEDIEAVLSRIDEHILPDSEKRHLWEIVNDMRTHQELTQERMIIAHFLTKLLGLHTEQQKKEHDVREFIKVCNRYLRKKWLQYDATEFKIHIRLANYTEELIDSSCILLKHLSSGEKQIVSLFSHLLLSDSRDFFVIIDEPELSLSVPWQRTFLVDILNTGRCSGFAAVTHSPFIFDNALDRHIYSLE